MKNKFFTLLSLLLFAALAQAQTSPAVTLTFLDNAEILDSCSGCTNPYPTAARLYDALRVGQSTLPGLYTILTDTAVTTLTNAHVDNVVNYSATQLTHTLNLPATPHDGQICRVLFNSIVTNLTIGGNGTTLRGTAATSAVVGTRLEFRYLDTLASPEWLRQL